VVHDAFETTLSAFGSYLSSLTPMTNMGASAEGAEMTTFLAPALKWGWHCGGAQGGWGGEEGKRSTRQRVRNISEQETRLGVGAVCWY
jgi:Spy/CpxP family protein refolding chaperone